MFNFDSKTTVLIGQDTVRELGAEAVKLGAQKALVVTDKGIVQAGILEKVDESLKAARINVAVFDAVEPNPGDKMILQGAQAARDQQADLIVGLGGGSPMDAAKAVAVMSSNDGPIESYIEIKDAWPNRPPPVICVPTTAGTGAEVSLCVFRRKRSPIPTDCDHLFRLKPVTQSGRKRSSESEATLE